MSNSVSSSHRDVYLCIGSNERQLYSDKNLWINLDNDLSVRRVWPCVFVRADALMLPFRDESVHFVNLSQVLEHFDLFNAVKLLRECHRVLVPGGRMHIGVPDLRLLVEDYLFGRLLRHKKFQPPSYAECLSEGLRFGMILFGSLAGTKEYTGHRMAYDWPALKEVLNRVGFHAVRGQFNPELDCVEGESSSLYVDATKN